MSPNNCPTRINPRSSRLISEATRFDVALTSGRGRDRAECLTVDQTLRVAFKLSRAGVMLVIVAGLGVLFAAMPLLGLGADVSPDSDNHLEQRYGTIGLGVALIWVVLMVTLAVMGIVMQFRQRPQRARRARR